MAKLVWDRTNPFIIEVQAEARHMDGYGHVSTHNFVQWMIECAFAHSSALGLSEVSCRDMARGMVVIHFEVNLVGSAYEGNPLKVSTWISKSDGKLRLARHCQIIHAETGRTLARGDFDFVCTNLDNGRPVRMPPKFLETYVVNSQEHPKVST
ncbi:MAG: thioesterase [Gammaproteobacteria bacterium]|nr:thioesterase [Gammaproteobacteria bacterium]